MRRGAPFERYSHDEPLVKGDQVKGNQTSLAFMGTQVAPAHPERGRP